MTCEYPELVSVVGLKAKRKHEHQIANRILCTVVVETVNNLHLAPHSSDRSIDLKNHIDRKINNLSSPGKTHDHLVRHSMNPIVSDEWKCGTGHEQCRATVEEIVRQSTGNIFGFDTWWNSLVDKCARQARELTTGPIAYLFDMNNQWHNESRKRMNQFDFAALTFVVGDGGKNSVLVKQEYDLACPKTRGIPNTFVIPRLGDSFFPSLRPQSYLRVTFGSYEKPPIVELAAPPKLQAAQLLITSLSTPDLH
jgi:hypothetical protein